MEFIVYNKDTRAQKGSVVVLTFIENMFISVV